MRSRSVRRSVFGVLVLVGLALLIAGVPGVEAKKKGKGSHAVSAIVVNPSGLRTNDPALAISQPEADGVPGPVEVRSFVLGTGHWVHLPLDLPDAIHSGKGHTHPLFVVGVEVCHQEVAELVPPPTSFIDTVRLTKLESPLGSEIEHEDETDFLSPAPTCLQSPVAFPFPVEGAVTLSLNLAFGKPDDVFRFGAIRVLLATRADREPSEPSEPSKPSHPSAPSRPSEPSDD